MALARPTRPASKAAPPICGKTPSVISGNPNRALSAAMTMSLISTSSNPPPNTYPATPATTGFEQRANASAALAYSSLLPAASATANSDISVPAAKNPASPFKTITRMDSSASKSPIAVANSRSIAAQTAFMDAGRFSVIIPIALLLSTVIVSKSMVQSFSVVFNSNRTVAGVPSSTEIVNSSPSRVKEADAAAAFPRFHPSWGRVLP